MISNLPTGTVTFLFTDIEGSTKLAQQYPDAMPALLARHHAILHQAIEAHHGSVFQIIGDAFSAAFYTVSDALNAALDAQRALVHEPWSPAAIKVRMGINTGAAQAGATEALAGGYSGYLTLTRVQRVMALAHGGQILLSHASAELVRNELPQGVTLRDMQEHRLKGLLHPERIWQVEAPDLPHEFPPLESRSAIPINVPLQFTNLIGREREIAQVREMISNKRLVTLTGPGGSGKTRLAIQVATELVENSEPRSESSFADGVQFVALTTITDPLLVTSTIAQVLELHEMMGQPLIETLKGYLREKQMLLALDNFEQVMPAAPLILELLRAAPRLKVLVTSREVLHLSGEQEFSVPPLDRPDLEKLPPLDQLSNFAAVQLFIERARAVKSGFALTSENARSIAEICARLDGLPLAIELAAARVKLLSPATILSQLQASGLKVVGGGARDLPARQQTLWNAIDWSYELLPEQERTLFRRLAVFAGGWTLEAALAICSSADSQDGAAADEIFDLLAHLIDKSLALVQDKNGATRYQMLGTIRQYALAKLAASDEAEIVRRRHAEYYLVLAEAGSAAPAATSASNLDWMELEYANLREALTWSQAAADGAEMGLRLALEVGRFWFARGLMSEANVFIAKLSAQSGATNNIDLRARVLLGIAFLDTFLGNYDDAQAKTVESLSLFQELGDRSNIALAFSRLGWLARERNDALTARRQLEESIRVSRELGDELQVGWGLVGLGEVAVMQEDVTWGTTLLDEGLKLMRQHKEKLGIAWGLDHLGHVAQLRSDSARAKQLHAESLALFHEFGAQYVGVAWAHQSLGETALAEGNASLAKIHLTEALGLSHDLGDKLVVTWCLAGLAGAAALEDEPERAIRLWGAAEALRTSIEARPAPAARATRERLMAQARAQLDEASFEAAWARGQAATTEEAIEYALENA